MPHRSLIHYVLAIPLALCLLVGAGYGDELWHSAVRVSANEGGESTSHGTGTVVATSQGRSGGEVAWIITCAHIFRESGGASSAVDVDVYYPRPANLRGGRVAYFNMATDVAVVSISTPANVQLIPAVISQRNVRVGDDVTSVGCGGGGAPTPWPSKVVSVDRYMSQGGSNIETTNLPREGRSGGGLFTSDGCLVGICNSASPTDGHGLYAGMVAVHDALSKAISWSPHPRKDAGALPVNTAGPSDPFATPNFVVQSGSPELSQEIGLRAEECRRELAATWIGNPMPKWAQPCTINVQAGNHLGAGGATSFRFENGEVFGWRMTVQGSKERLLDSVVPHEVLHTVLASHFRQPLPRWADEGACSTTEHASEKSKQQMMLIDFLQTERCIPVNVMLRASEYPQDVMPLYSQGYSITQFLIHHNSQRGFVDFLESALASDWDKALAESYEIPNAHKLHEAWLSWVKAGSPAPPHVVGYQYGAPRCRWVPQQQRWDCGGQPQQPVVSRPVPSRPQPPPTVPSVPPSGGAAGCQGKCCECKDKIAKLEARLCLLEKLKDGGALKGEKGEPGPKGDKGDKGDIGPAGVPGAIGPKGAAADVVSAPVEIIRPDGTKKQLLWPLDGKHGLRLPLNMK